MYNCRFGLDTEYPITLDNVDCFTSNYLTILQCSYSTIISSSCDDGIDDVSVTCCELLTDNFLNCKKIKVTWYANTLECIRWLISLVLKGCLAVADLAAGKPLLALHCLLVTLYTLITIKHYHQTITLILLMWPINIHTWVSIAVYIGTL